MKKPVIGVTPLYDLALQSMWILSNYFEAIEAAGGIPVMLSIKNAQPETDRLLDILDGVLLTGGNDICPLYYGENISEYCAATVPDLDEMEILLAKSAYERKIPLMGICRGCQLINVAMGGTLYQDIPSQIEREIPLIHAQKKIVPKEHPIHSVHILKDSRLYDCFGRDIIMVNSLHHQSCKTIAPQLFAAAHAEDGVVEAVESVLKDRFLLGVQWHPELMFLNNEDAFRLFKCFIDYAAM